MNILDLCSGIGGFTLASDRSGWNTIGLAEIDSYGTKVLDKNFGYDNFHDVNDIALPESSTSYAYLLDQDEVPCEVLNHETLTYEDCMEDVIPYANLICAGSPCQDVTLASPTNSEGIGGIKSSVINRILDIVETLNPEYFVLENSSNIINRGLCKIVERLMKIGFVVEWETISAAHFGYNHYRHRCYLVAYQKELYTGDRLFDAVAAQACFKPDERLPLKKNWTPELLDTVYVINPKSIKNRQARINGLGNAVLPNIAYAVFRAIDLHQYPTKQALQRLEKKPINAYPLKSNPKTGVTYHCMPNRGLAHSGDVESLLRCTTLNPTNQTYDGMLSTLLSADKKNNFTTLSRLNRPGGLGGLVGSFMKMGVDKGALDPRFCERFMGFSDNYTLLPEHSL